MPPDLLIGATFAALVLAGVARLAGCRRRWPLALALFVGTVVVVAGLGLRQTREPALRLAEELSAATPTRHEGEGYVGSGECKSCHPAEHGSWYQSFHRTMTTLATPENVKAPFTGETLAFKGREYRMIREGEAYYAELVDPVAEWDRREGRREPALDHDDPLPVVRKRIVMITGSHHQQVFWVPGAAPGQLDFVPIVWLVQDQRWRAMSDVFLGPRSRPEHLRLWNQDCLRCHAVHGIAGPSEDDHGAWRFDTEVGELGISCEACHGPGRKHVEARRSPLARWKERANPEGDSTIVNPTRLEAARSSEVCGICHGIIYSKSLERWYEQGHGFRPGERIGGNEILLRNTDDASRPYIDVERNREPDWAERRFWADGEVRVSGREYNGLVESPCFQRGTMSCTSCHRLHGSEPDDQLDPARRDDASCTQCHPKIAEKLEDHTHHVASSSGSRCLNCHMPHTNWGLLKAIRSHTITSPNLTKSLRAARPNACNLCHLDRSLAWTSEALGRFYGQAPVPLDQDQATLAAAVLWLGRGDAGVRALTAWHLGFDEARRVSGGAELDGYLGLVLDDTYPAVGYVAGRSLERFATSPLDPRLRDETLPAEERAAAIRAYEDARAALPGPAEASRRAALGLDRGLRPSRELWERLLERRDHRGINLAE